MTIFLKNCGKLFKDHRPDFKPKKKKRIDICPNRKGFQSQSRKLKLSTWKLLN